jgi:arylsulfatase
MLFDSHFGCSRNAMICSWPDKIKETGVVRSPFHHVIDLMPTLMEVAGIKEAKEVNGYIQRPIEGVSFAYTFAKGSGDAPSTRTQQYFEMLGNRAMYADGWIASCRHGRLPWETSGSFSFADDKWELYNLADDFSQAVDLADKEPARLDRLKQLFMGDAVKYNVLPIDDRFSERLDTTLRPSYFHGRKQVTFYPGLVRLPEGSGPRLIGVPFTLTAKVKVPEGGAEGVIFALGGDAAGFSLFLWEGKARFHYNFFGMKRHDAVSPEKLTPGEHTIVVTFLPDGPKPGGPASAALSVDGKVVGQCRIDEQIPQRCGTETMDVGMDCVSPVCADYEKRGLFPFTGEIESVRFDFEHVKAPSGMDRLKMATAMD